MESCAVGRIGMGHAFGRFRRVMEGRDGTAADSHTGTSAPRPAASDPLECHLSSTSPQSAVCAYPEVGRARLTGCVQ